ncbi:unnamed protein product [Mytilus edulis]|uniref:Uncharacterized protein n=1 Tax=Mytilus edulis TaxID=6550 RepID=A0A8S3U273_MYTED|nr:unnamed protein product [Mytilus edulis]
MATRKSKRQPKRKMPYERPPVDSSEDPSTWSKTKLIQELKGMDIEVPVDLSKPIILQLFNSNIKRKEATVIEAEVIPDIGTLQSPPEQRPFINPEPEAGIPMSNMCNAFVSMSQCFTGLQSTVTQLLLRNPGEKQQNTIKDGFTLQHWYNQSTTVDNYTASHSGIQENCVSVDTNKGARSDDFTGIDIVSSSLQRQIIDGKDVNIAALLIPNYECPQSHTVIADSIEVNLPGKPDIRLNRTLTIQEFIKAFGKYKRIMSKAYPERRVELDAYEEDIIDISNFYGSKYYDYHKMFSAKASTLLREHHVKVDWSKRDRDLFTLVAAGIQISVCKLCHMCDHTTEFCPLQLRNSVNHQEINSSRNDDRGDKYGRPKYFQDGKEICNNFNSIRGCTKRTCSFHMFAPNAVRQDIHRFYVGNAHQQRLHPIRHPRLIKKLQRHLVKCD